MGNRGNVIWIGYETGMRVTVGGDKGGFEENLTLIIVPFTLYILP